MTARKQKTNTTSAAERTAAPAPKLSKAAAKRAEHDAAIKALRPLARTINAKLKSAANMEGKADDARLQACVAISEAYEIARGAHIKFKTWCEEHCKILGYESLRKMRPIGDAERETEGAGLAMLQALRAGNAANNRAARSRKATGESTGESTSERASVPRVTDPLATMREIFATLTADQQVEFTIWCEEQIGSDSAGPKAASA